MSTPFKFLDAYTKEDKDIFFGRDHEIEELYQKVFDSKVLLVCGVSGTGKTSLINCGLANKFEESDWLPVHMRRGVNIVDSLWRELEKVAITPIQGMKGRGSEEAKGRDGEWEQGGKGEKGRKGEGAKGRRGDGVNGREGDWEKERIVKTIQSIYLDHFKPIYLIFDQFEEVFIFGNREERKEFIKEIKNIIDSDVQCRLLFVMREEYLAGAIEFEREIPTFLTNRIRIEKMTWANARHVIEEPCKVYGIEVEEDLAENILGKLSPESTEIELTYLQVLLDKMYRSAVEKDKEKPVFSNNLLSEAGDVSDLLGSFLEEQISQMEDPDTGLVILKSFVSVKGTKRQVTSEDINEFALTLGKDISEDNLKNLIQKFVNLRILRDKDESGRYELRHDSLAEKIFEKITLVEKELLEVRQFIENAYENYNRRGILLNREDIEYIRIYEDRLFLIPALSGFINTSKSALLKEERTFKRITRMSVVGLILILVAITYYFLGEKKSERSRDYAVEAMLQLESSPGLSFETAYLAYLKDSTTTTAIKALFNAFYAMQNSDPYIDSLGNYIDPSKVIFNFRKCNTEILFADFTMDGKLIYGYLADQSIRMWELNGTEIFNLQCGQPIIVGKVSFDNQYIAVVTGDSTVTIFNRQGEVVSQADLQYDLINPADVINFSHSGNYLLLAGSNNEVVILDYIRKSEEVLSGHNHPVTSVKFSPDDQFIGSASKDSTVIIWRYNKNSGKYDLFNKIKAHRGIVWSVDFSSNSKYILTTSADSTYAIFNFYGRKVYGTDYYSYIGDWIIRQFGNVSFINARFTGKEYAIVLTYYRRHYYTGPDPIKGEIENKIENLVYYNRIDFDVSSPYHMSRSNYYLANSIQSFNQWQFEYESFDYSQDGLYLASKSHGSNTTRLSYKDDLKIIEFTGSQPKFNDNGKYLLCIDKYELKLYVSDVKEIIRLVNDEQIFGKLPYDRSFW